ncbi:MAG: glycosyl transferase family 1 [Croceibacter sp.]|nr:glycosyl transferase family 1 [Croceibacter sp.]
MKILIVAIPSIHTRRWISQLKDSGIEVHWFDILNGGRMTGLDWVHQHTNWRWRFGDFKGRTFIKKHLSFLHKLLERDPAKEFEKLLNTIKPEIVQSIVLYKCAAPILPIMMKYPHIKWIYSAWGNDLYYYQHFNDYKKEIDSVLPYLDYMFADCKRDLQLAVRLGFRGEILGSFPGGGGYHLEMIDEPVKAYNERQFMILKGYQSDKHRALNVLKALELCDISIPIIIFSADKTVSQYIKNSKKLQEKVHQIYTKEDSLSHKELLRLMNRSMIYIGNNLSDGMPNTLLESICFGAFPIQSNPGGATAEIIDHNQNGLLIEDCEDIVDIKNNILEAVNRNMLRKKAFDINMLLRQKLEYQFVRDKVLKQYEFVFKDKLNIKR